MGPESTRRRSVSPRLTLILCTGIPRGSPSASGGKLSSAGVLLEVGLTLTKERIGKTRSEVSEAMDGWLICISELVLDDEKGGSGVVTLLLRLGDVDGGLTG
jgi:hypothetical protein